MFSTSHIQNQCRKPRSRKQRSSTRSTQLSSRSRNTQRKVRKKACHQSVYTVCCLWAYSDWYTGIEFWFCTCAKCFRAMMVVMENPLRALLKTLCLNFSTQNTPNVSFSGCCEGGFRTVCWSSTKELVTAWSFFFNWWTELATTTTSEAITW